MLSLSVRDANANRSAYVYDGFDRLSELHFPSPTLGAGVASATDYEAYGYDANSNRTSLRLRSGETIAFGYDALNRETLRDIPGGAANDVYSAYDLAGRRQSARFASAGGQGVIYAYDSAGRLSTETSTIGTSRALGFQYDAASNRTRITWPDGVYAQYTYDALNRVDQIGENGVFSGASLLADYAYDALSRRTSIARGNGAASTATYDTASRLTGLAHDFSGATSDQTLGFSYTAASQVSQRTASNDNYNWTGLNVSRAYNRNGLNQYTSVAGTNYTYDARGNLTSDGSRTFMYDLENRLLSVSGSASLSLAYDPLGRLRSTTANSISTEFLYDGDRLVAEYSSAGTLLRRYVHGTLLRSEETDAFQDEPIVWYEGVGLTDRRWLIPDHQNSIIATNDNSGTTTIQSYGPYGEPLSWSGSRFRYTGQAALPDAQLYYYRARVYDPILGRFLQTDPIGYEESYNLYQYAANDPLNNTDPSGRILDTIADVVFVLADAGILIHDELTTGGANRTENLAALGADIVGAVVPFATGGGLAVRGARAADNASDAARAADTRTARDPLRTENGRQMPDPEARGAAHTQLGTRTDSDGRTYNQRREFDAEGRPVNDTDFTDHGRSDHPNPHRHDRTEVSGSFQRGTTRPLREDER